MNAFAELGLNEQLLTALATLGYEEPTPIQTEAIPQILEGHDVLGQAATGTGKTAAFALPFLQLLDRRAETPSVLVLVPTRELAMQVSEAMFKYGKAFDDGTAVVPVYGGQPIFHQIKALRRGAQVVVATPGRAIDHVNRGTLDLSGIRHAVLDEADEMLDMGFAEDIETLLSAMPADRQTVLFSATMPSRIAKIAKAHLRKPVTIRIERDDSAPNSGSISHTAYIVARQHKAAALGRILDVEEPTAAIVFCRTRGEVDTLTETLNGRGYRAEALHGGMDQEQRDRVMGRMRSATAELLIATDVAARGLDLDHLTHVVNYDVPSSTEAYTHRVGRVGRAGRSGVAITLTEPREQRLLGNIERVMGTKVKIAQIPNVAELRAHQEESTRNDLREAVLAGDDGRFQRVVDSLAEEFDLREIAAAAARLYHQAAGNVEDAEEIPEARPPKPDRGDRFDKGAGRKGAYGKGSGKGGGDDRAQIFIGLGRAARLSPGDLVGAIANETSLSGKQIGPIKIGEKFSIVGVPPESVDEVIDALRQTQIRGRSAQVRRYVENRQPPRDRKHNRK